MRITVVLWFGVMFSAAAQQQPHAAEIRLKLEKLNVLASVLYVAAHPDDENTRAITYFANERLATTAYLSLTRGDGGQNLIGPELRDDLGLIRTYELLAARKIDGGEQFFTRANDFGFSKTAEETMKVWGEQEVLSDVVRIYRQFQPDIIITRFPPTEQAGHGHHIASAILAEKAFDLSGDANAFPDIKNVWQSKRLFTNTGRWWNTTINESTPGVLSFNVGRYNTLLGESYTEIAARSRSQHKSQGFGSRGVRGDQIEFLELRKGEPANRDPFEGVNTSWSRIRGAEDIHAMVQSIIRMFDVQRPSTIVPDLGRLYQRISKLEQSVWKDRKLAEIKDIIADCLGLYIAVDADTYQASPGKAIGVNVEIVNRSTTPVTIRRIVSHKMSYDTLVDVTLENNKAVNLKSKRMITSAAPYSTPYWLREPHDDGLFTVANADDIGKPASDPAVVVTTALEIAGQLFDYTVPLQYRWTDPVKGELIRPFAIIPALTVDIEKSVYLFTSSAPVNVRAIVRSLGEGSASGTIRLELPSGWKSEPETIEFTNLKSREELPVSFSVQPSTTEGTTEIKAVINSAGQTFSQSLERITYDHIPVQTILRPAVAKAVRTNLRIAGKKVGYIRGAGDDIPKVLRDMGYEVWEIPDNAITLDNIQHLDAIVLGIRALNTNERLALGMNTLLAYVNNGGTLVVQYNTAGTLVTDNFSPYPLTLSRDRVTEENATVRFLLPDHPVLNEPNKITPSDFLGWTQERGLYFPNRWDERYDAILSMNDTDEPARDGSLLITRYGKGYYVYTGISFFRELPGGVPGAFKLFANIVSLGKSVGEVSERRKRKK